MEQCWWFNCFLFGGVEGQDKKVYEKEWCQRSNHFNLALAIFSHCANDECVLVQLKEAHIEQLRDGHHNGQ